MFIFEIIAVNALIIAGISSLFIGVYSIIEDFLYWWTEHQYEETRWKINVIGDYGLGRCGYRNEILLIQDFLRSKKSRPHLKIRSIEYQ